MINEIAEQFERVVANANDNRKHQLAIIEAALTVLQRDFSKLDEQLKQLRVGVDKGKVEREAVTDTTTAARPVEDTLETIGRRLGLLTSAYQRFLAEDQAMETLYGIAEAHAGLESVLPADREGV